MKDYDRLEECCELVSYICWSMLQTDKKISGHYLAGHIARIVDEALCRAKGIPVKDKK